MTIAIGMLAEDGIVVAADTQETTPQWMKTSQSKILPAIAGQRNRPDIPKRVCLISGAGHAGYLDTINLKIAHAFLDDQTHSLAEMEEPLERVVKDFYENHVIPFAQFSSPPEFALIMAAQRQLIAGSERFEQRLWITDNNAIRYAMPFVAVGVGSTYARILLDRLWMRCDVATAKIIAAYVVYQVKECIDGCGKWTEVVAVKGGTVDRHWRHENLEDMERVFRKYMWAEGNAFNYVATHPSKNADNNIKPFSDFLKKTRKELMDIIEKAEKDWQEEEASSSTSEDAPQGI